MITFIEIMKVIFMGNANVIYIDYLESYLDVLNSNFSKWFRNDDPFCELPVR